MIALASHEHPAAKVHVSRAWPRIQMNIDIRGAARHRRPMTVTESMTEGRAAAYLGAIAAAQDRSAFIALFEYYAPRIKTQNTRFRLPPDVAEEIAQETMIAVWTKARLFDPARGSASAWIFQIAANRRIDRTRRARLADAAATLNPMEGAAAGVAPLGEEVRADDALGQRQLAGHLTGALDILSAEQRAVVELSFYEDVPHANIAERLGLPLGTVKSRIRLALQSLRAALEGTR